MLIVSIFLLLHLLETPAWNARFYHHHPGESCSKMPKARFESNCCVRSDTDDGLGRHSHHYVDYARDDAHDGGYDDVHDVVNDERDYGD